MMPGVLYFLLAPLALAHTPAIIFRYPGYTGCDTVAGTVIFHAASGVQQMLLSLKTLPPNATGLIQVRNGVNCFDPFQIGGNWLRKDPEQFAFEADENGTVEQTLQYGNVTVDTLMGRSVLVVLQNENSTTRIGCGTVGLSYPATVGPYPGVTPKVQGSIAVTGPLKAMNFSEPAHGPTQLQLAFALTNLPPSTSGTLQVFSGSSCRNLTLIGTLWGTNWTSNYTADANGIAIGNADITFVSPSRGVQDYIHRVLVVGDSEGKPLACAVLDCPTGSIEEGQNEGPNVQHGRCKPAAIWVSSTVVAADFYSSQTAPLQIQVSAAAFELTYGEVRSYPACAELGKLVTTSFFLRASANVEGVIGGQFFPVPGSKQVVVLSDRQPESVGRQDNNVNVSFLQSSQPNMHDIVHVAVGVPEVIFRVGQAGFRSEARLDFRETAKIAFPTSATPTNTTVWITNSATGAIIYQKAFLFGKSSPNFVWFLYGWDASAPDCSKLKNCKNTPITVTTWPGVREDYGPGVIPPITQFGSSLMCVPSFFFVLALAFF